MASHSHQPDNPLRILMVEPHGWRGLAHYAHNLCQALTEHNTEVILLTTFDYELVEFPRNFMLKRILFGFRDRVSRENLFLKLIRILKGLFKHPYNFTVVVFFALFCSKIDVIHYQCRLGRLGLLNIRLISSIRKCIVYTSHEVLPQNRDDKKTRAYYRNIYRKVQGIIVHSEDSKFRLLELADVEPCIVDVIRHGTYSFFATDGSLYKSGAKASMGLRQNAKVILFFGTLSPYKGLKYLIRAFKEVPAHISEAILLIAGHGATEAEESAYLSLINQTEISNSVVFFNKYADMAEVQIYFTASDVVILPYVDAYTSGVLQIAYAFSKPVITTDVGELPEVVEEGKTGLVVPSRDEIALFNAIVNILGDKNKLAEMGRRAKELSVITFSWETAAKKTIATYKKLHRMRERRFDK